MIDILVFFIVFLTSSPNCEIIVDDKTMAKLLSFELKKGTKYNTQFKEEESIITHYYAYGDTATILTKDNGETYFMFVTMLGDKIFNHKYLRIGMNTKELSKSVGLKIPRCKKLVIKNEEEINYIVFDFFNDKLVKVKLFDTL